MTLMESLGYAPMAWPMRQNDAPSTDGRARRELLLDRSLEHDREAIVPERIELLIRRRLVAPCLEPALHRGIARQRARAPPRRS